MTKLKPYQRLWASVLKRAILDTQSSNSELRDEAKNWLFSDIMDFNDICLCIGINPEKLRERLKTYLQSLNQKGD